MPCIKTMAEVDSTRRVGESGNVILQGVVALNYDIEIWKTEFKVRCMGMMFSFYLTFHELAAVLDLQIGDGLELPRNYHELWVSRAGDKVTFEHHSEDTDASIELFYQDVKEVLLTIGVRQARYIQSNPEDILYIGSSLTSRLGSVFAFHSANDLNAIIAIMRSRWDAMQPEQV